MYEVTFDTFISYRRADGTAYAGTIYDFLLSKGFVPFLDRTEMENNRFDEQIRFNLINSENYIVILSVHSFDRINEKDDWLRREIRLAIENNLNIIVLLEDGFIFPEYIPPEIQDITNYQQYPFKYNTLNSSLKEIEPRLLKRSNAFNVLDPNIDGKIRLSGDYITLFEDEDNGRIVIRKAPAHLRIFGNRVFGKTSFGASTSWIIKGRIHKKKRITGLYYAKSVLDDGFGTFYLEVKSPSIMDGYWCGYDNINNKVFCGKYIFRKIYREYLIRQIQEFDFPRIVYISDKQLGKNYVSSELLEDAATGEQSFCLVAADKKTKQPIGFSICMIIDYEKVKEICKGKTIKELKNSQRIGCIKTVVVDKTYEGFGIATKLVEECIAKMKSKGCNCFISTAWKHCGIINISNVLRKSGFEKSIEIPNYWYEDSIKEGYLCPQCGNPCHCSCVVYIKL